MTQPWLRWPLCLLACTAPIHGQEVTISELESVTTLQFWRGSAYLDQERTSKLCAWIESKGKEGPWIIAIPLKSGITEAAIQSVREALQHCGVRNIRRMIIQTEVSGDYDWLHVGKSKKASPPTGGPEQSSQNQQTAQQSSQIASQPPSKSTEQAATPSAKGLPEGPRKTRIPRDFLDLGAGVEYETVHIQAPDQTRLQKEGHALLTLSAKTAFRFIELGISYGKDLQSLSKKPTWDFSPIAGVSEGAIHQLEKQGVFIAFPSLFMPFKLSYEKTRLSTGAALNSTLIVMTPKGQILPFSGNHYKIPLENSKKMLSLDLTTPFGQTLRANLGLHYTQYQSPLSVKELSQNKDFLTKTDLKAYGIHARRQGDLTPLGLDLFSVEIQLSYLKGDQPNNTYIPTLQKLGSGSSLQIGFHYAPSFTQHLSKKMHARIAIPLSYQHLFKAETSVQDGLGNQYRAKRCLPDFSYGLSCEFGYRF